MKSTLTILLMFYIFDLNGQCTGNLLTNGSFTSPEGEAVIAQGWNGQSTPDVNDAAGPLNTTMGYAWTGTPLASSDGGTWQNIFSQAEYIQQTVNVAPGQDYMLKFEYTAQGIQSTDFTFTDPVGISIYINDVLVYETPLDTTPFTWEHYCYIFTAESNVLTLKLSASATSYAAIDGV